MSPSLDVCPKTTAHILFSYKLSYIFNAFALSGRNSHRMHTQGVALGYVLDAPSGRTPYTILHYPLSIIHYPLNKGRGSSFAKAASPAMSIYHPFHKEQKTKNNNLDGYPLWVALND